MLKGTFKFKDYAFGQFEFCSSHIIPVFYTFIDLGDCVS